MSIAMDDQAASLSTKRRRGPTRAEDIWDLPAGQKISLILNNEGQVVGYNATKLTKFWGTVARDSNLAPIYYKDWKAFPEMRKEQIWALIQEKFDIIEKGKKFALSSTRKEWKDYKANLKSFHFVGRSIIEAKRNCPEGVPLNHWEITVDFWNSPDGMKRSTIGKSNRSKQKYVHTGGTKSNARLRHEMTNENGGVEPSKGDVFLRTHTTKKGTAADEQSATAMENMRKTAQRRATTSGGEVRILDEDFDATFGPERHGYVRTWGLAVTPTQLNKGRKQNQIASTSTTRTNKEEDREHRIKALEDKLEKYSKKWNKLFDIMPEDVKALFSEDEN